MSFSWPFRPLVCYSSYASYLGAKTQVGTEAKASGWMLSDRTRLCSHPSLHEQLLLLFNKPSQRIYILLILLSWTSLMKEMAVKTGVNRSAFILLLVLHICCWAFVRSLKMFWIFYIFSLYHVMFKTTKRITLCTLWTLIAGLYLTTCVHYTYKYSKSVAS